MTQPPLPFDLTQAESRRDQGTSSVAASNADFVEHMRHIAEDICRDRGQVTCDDLRRYALRHGLKPKHPNAWGAVFRGNGWRCIGRAKSQLASNHAREIRVWELVP